MDPTRYSYLGSAFYNGQQGTELHVIPGPGFYTS